MKKRMTLLRIKSGVILLVMTVFYVLNFLGRIGEAAIYPPLAPLMFSIIGLTCCICAEGGSEEKRDC